MARRASSDRAPRPPRAVPEAAPEGPACVYGVRPVAELLEGEPDRVVRVHFAEGHHGAALGRLLAVAKARHLPYLFEPRGRLDDLAGGPKHQGVVAEVAAVPYADLETVIARALADPPGLIVVLDGIEDPRNLGAVIRTAEAAGCHGMIVPKRHAAPLTGVAAKASAGASLLLPLARVENTVRALETLKGRGFWVYGLDAAAETAVSAPDYGVPVALVMGAEGKGLRPLVARACDALVRIPLKGRTASLNVSAAAAVGIFAVRARREGW
jgi:23S rRNA (guanosine2251-2'-O)-methyltransferase